MEVAPFFVNFHHFLSIFTIFYRFSRFTHFCRDLHFVAIYALFPQFFLGQSSHLCNITRFLQILTLPLICCAKILMERNLNSVCFSWSAFLQAGIVFDVFQTPTLFRRFQRLFFCGSQTSPAGLSQLLTRGRRKRSSKKTDLLPRKCSYS